MRYKKQTEVLTHVTYVNDWEPAVYMSYLSRNFRLFLVSNLSVLNFDFFLLMYPWSETEFRFLPDVRRAGTGRTEEGMWRETLAKRYLYTHTLFISVCVTCWTGSHGQINLHWLLRVLLTEA